MLSSLCIAPKAGVAGCNASLPSTAIRGAPLVQAKDMPGAASVLNAGGGSNNGKQEVGSKDALEP